MRLTLQIFQIILWMYLPFQMLTVAQNGNIISSKLDFNIIYDLRMNLL